MKLWGCDRVHQTALTMDRPACSPIEAEIDRATNGKIRAHLQGVSRDGALNRLQRMLRISKPTSGGSKSSGVSWTPWEVLPGVVCRGQ